MYGLPPALTRALTHASKGSWKAEFAFPQKTPLGVA